MLCYTFPVYLLISDCYVAVTGLPGKKLEKQFLRDS
jgi:hypothetical protein